MGTRKFRGGDEQSCIRIHKNGDILGSCVSLEKQVEKGRIWKEEK